MIQNNFSNEEISSKLSIYTTSIERRLHDLERARFVRRSRRSSVGGETEYAFLHLLVRDVAYGQIPRGARADKHRAAAAWIGALAGERLEDRSELLAHHYLSALELARAAGKDTTDLERPARLALQAAGDRALGLGAYAGAERAFQAALGLWLDDDPERAGILFRYGKTLWLAHDQGADVLAEARDAFLATGDVDAAAEAELMIADLEWRTGHGEAAQAYVERAQELIRDRPPSSALANVKSHLARFFMVAGRNDEAILVGREALALAQHLRRDDITTFALNSVGVARIGKGDLGGFADIEESIDVAERASLPWHITRGTVNLGVSFYYTGDVRRALEVHEHNLGLARRYAMEGSIIWNLAEVAFGQCLTGRWDESMAIVDAEIGRIEAGAPHYLETQFRQTRARIRLGRGDVAGALDDVDRGIAAGRAAGDLQALMPPLATRALILFLRGREEEAEAVVSEIVGRQLEPALDWAWWVVEVSIVLSGRGRGDDVLALGGESLPSKWIQVARLWASGDLAGSAELFEEIGSTPDEAYARQKEAERLIAAGRRSEAEPFLDRALELYREMGATAFIRDAERLLAPPA
jgi:tetratricopeptide (TPR) repeat protein